MAFWAIRSTSRRSASPDRIAAIVSSWSRSRRVTGWLLGCHGIGDAVPASCADGGEPGSRSRSTRGVGRRSDSALARACVLLALRFLALPLHRRLLVVLAPASLGEDAALLDLLVEAAEGALERLVLTHSDFGQSRFTSSGRSLAPASRTRCPTAQGASRRPCAQGAPSLPAGRRSVRARHDMVKH